MALPRTREALREQADILRAERLNHAGRACIDAWETAVAILLDMDEMFGVDPEDEASSSPPATAMARAKIIETAEKQIRAALAADARASDELLRELRDGKRRGDDADAAYKRLKSKTIRVLPGGA